MTYQCRNRKCGLKLEVPAHKTMTICPRCHGPMRKLIRVTHRFKRDA